MLFGDSPSPGLVGIARLASQSEVLEAKRVVQYFEIETRSLLNRVRPGMPFEWSLNPYRGCEFACRYCYARYTHEFMELRRSEDFEDRIYAKSRIAETLKRDLRKIDPAEGVAIGTSTDPYQPAERRFKRTQAALEVFAERSGAAVSITTKSDLVVRDLPLLQRIAEHNAINVNITITTTDMALARMLEPRAPRPELRLKAVETLSKAGIPVGVFPNPIMPLITDQPERLENLARAARDHGAGYFGGGILFLQPCARKVFFPFLEAQFPHLLRRYQEKYERNAYLRGEYAEGLQKRIAALREKYGLNTSPPHRKVAALSEAQGLLF